jgi:vesicular inhibitory amino acid transporter
VLLGEDEEVTAEHRHLHHHEDHHREHESSSEPGQEGSSQQSQSATETTPLMANGKPNDGAEDDEFAPLRSKVQGAAQERIEQLAQQREETRAQLKDDQREPLLVTKVHRDDGTEAEVIVGQSTLPQTIFNSSNVLIGVGILSLPLGIAYAGWVFGLIGLLLSAVVSKYTAGLLAKCIDVDSSLANFADVAYVSFGEPGRIITSSLITLELMVACVGLVILFADSLGSLIDGPSPVTWKILCGCMLAPLQFLPMRLLGFTSFLGIFCNLLIIVVGLVVGLLKAQSPGSLREVATTYAFPPHWKALPLSFGLIMGG